MRSTADGELENVQLAVRGAPLAQGADCREMKRAAVTEVHIVAGRDATKLWYRILCLEP